MKKQILAILAFTLLTTACSRQTPEEKIRIATEERVYALNADERLRSQSNAKAYFEKEWVIAGNQRGQLNECRPTDSNTNGFVSCSGSVPNPNGGYKEQKRYCGYTPKVVGCSDVDGVAN
jgi:hypothetical protein